MNHAAMLRQFRSEVVSTAPSETLLTMLYDRLVLDLDRAEAALLEGPATGAHGFLTNAQEIIYELRCSLDVSVWEGGAGLMRLYDYVYSALVQANMKGDVERVRECRKIVAPLRDAWHQAAAQVRLRDRSIERSAGGFGVIEGQDVVGELGVG